MNIGEQIKKYRLEAKLSQRELGERLGISQQQIAQYENGKRIPKIETINNIANALGTTTDKLRGIKTLEHFTPEVITQDKRIDEILSYSLNRILSGYGFSCDDIRNFPSNIKADLYNATLHHVTYDENYNNVTIYPLIQPKDIISNRLAELYNMLNTTGKKEAVKRVQELTEIPRYTKPEEEPPEE